MKDLNNPDMLNMSILASKSAKFPVEIEVDCISDAANPPAEANPKMKV